MTTVLGAGWDQFDRGFSEKEHKCHLGQLLLQARLRINSDECCCNFVQQG